MQLRLLIYSHAFVPNVGGVETYVRLLAQGLAERIQDGEDDWEITVATSTPAGTMKDSALPFRVVRRPSLLALIGLVHEADVIHLAGPALLPLLVGLALRKPVLIEHHGYQAVCPNGLLLYEPTKTVCPGHFMARSYSKCLRCNAPNVGWVRSAIGLLLAFPRHWACERVARNLPISHHVKGRLGLPRAEVIYYGIPDPLQGDTKARQRCQDLIESPVTYAYVGRLVSEKGLHLLLEAALRLDADGQSFQLKFVGDGPERSRLEKQVEALALGRRVSFTGYLHGQQLENALAGVAAVVMPSICEETAGLSAIEHMMRSRVVIAADIGGLGEIVDSSGLKFPAGDVDGLASCMKRVADEPDMARAFGKKARQRAQQLFQAKRMVAEHAALYRGLMMGPDPSPHYEPTI